MDKSSRSYRNRLLQLLEPADFDRLWAHLEPVPFEYRQPLYEANEDIAYVYFPIEGVVSLSSVQWQTARLQRSALLVMKGSLAFR